MERKPILKNLHTRKKTISVVNLGENSVAEKVAKELKNYGFGKVIVFNCLARYPNYYRLFATKTDYILIVEKGEFAKVQPCNTDFYLHERNQQENRIAKAFYKHNLKMLGLEPKLKGVKKIPYDEVKDIKEFFESKNPVIYVRVPEVEGIEKAICDSVSDYFREKFELLMDTKEEEKEECPNCLYGSVSR